jgi:hypothetical protein
MASISVAVFLLALQAQRPLDPRPESIVPTAVFSGSGQNTIAAMTSDSSGNLYLAGSTSSPDFPVLNAAQPQFGESQVMRSADRGTTWTKRTSPPGAPLWIQPDPVAASVVFAGTAAGIFRSTDTGQSWTLVYPWHILSGVMSGMGIDPGNHLHLIAAVASGSVIQARMAATPGRSALCRGRRPSGRSSTRSVRERFCSTVGTRFSLRTEATRSPTSDHRHPDWSTRHSTPSIAVGSG